jgi:hypothetical protein
MFLARNGGYFSPDKREPLVRFVLNKERPYLDPKFRFWVYFVAPGPLRDTPPCVVLDTNTGEFRQGMELSFPPFGYQVTMGPVRDEPRLFEITHFTRYHILEMAQVRLRLGVLPTHTPVLGDYRSFDSVSGSGGQPHVVLEHLPEASRRRPRRPTIM